MNIQADLDAVKVILAVDRMRERCGGRILNAADVISILEIDPAEAGQGREPVAPRIPHVGLRAL